MEKAVHDYRLSKRGTHNFLYADLWGAIETALQRPWTLKDPAGTVMLGLAENSMMHDEVTEYVQRHIGEPTNLSPVYHLTYGKGPRGSTRLREALAFFFNNDFKARQKLKYSEFIVLTGASSAVDSLTWAICNDGEGIILTRPLYSGFKIDICNRARGIILQASFHGIEGYRCLDDMFDPEMNRKAYEAAYHKAQKDGIVPKAVILVNPHNPLGKCYSVESLREIVRFCGRYNLHLISNEIYAKSTYVNPDAADAVPFTSILALDLDGLIDPRLVHIIYGASKDFCANGLRLGVVHTRNEGVLGAMSSNSCFSWPSYIIQDAWAAMLEDRKWLASYFSRNQELLAERYNIAAKFFRDRGVSFYEKTNAGLFIWVDFRRFLFPESNAHPDLSTLVVGSATSAVYKEREARIVALCMQNGVMIGYGSNFLTEELGWFRVTFTTRRDALLVGLERVWKSVKGAQAEWPDDSQVLPQR